MLRRIARGVIAAGAGSFAIALLATTLLLVASAGAPAPVERRPLDYDDRPAEVVADAVHNLGAAEYAYDVRVVESGRHVVGDGPEPILAQHVSVDNAARRYRSTLVDPDEEGRGPRIRFYSESFVGYRHVPASLGGGGWSRHGELAYAGIRNAFYDAPPRDAHARRVTENGTTYVARITDPTVAVDVGHPGYPHPFTSLGTVRPPLDNVTANLTVTVDKRTGHVTRAVLRYHNPDPGGPRELDPSGPRTSVVTYEFSGYGSTAVGRPLLTQPPGPRTLLYRLDLGVWALTEGRGWARVGALVVRLLVAAVVVALVAVGARRWRSGADGSPPDRTVAPLERFRDVAGSAGPGDVVAPPELPGVIADRWPADSEVDWEGYARAPTSAMRPS